MISVDDATIPIVMGPEGAIPTPPATLLTNLLALVASEVPGYTANLPGSLIEDVSSTSVGALTMIDQALIEFVNSITPYGANAYILAQLGSIYGVPQGIGSNTSVYVVFSGSPGFVIPEGFLVGDGTYQYTVQDGGIIGTPPPGLTLGQTEPLFCLANSGGSWAVPSGTVTQLLTSVPSGVTLSVTNPSNGTPGAAAQPIENYQAQVIQAGLATAQGCTTFVKTLLNEISGVQSNLISIQKVTTNEWIIICGGGDPYQIANAIFAGWPDLSTLVGSTLEVTNISNAYPGVVTTNLNHGYSTGQVIEITGVTGMSGINSVSYVAVVLTEDTFSLGVPISTITWSSSSGGTVTVTTVTAHGLPGGTSAGYIAGCLPAAYNGSFTFTETGADTFTYPLASNPGVSTAVGYTGMDTQSLGSYVSGGVVTPNLRNITVSINDYPDTYAITFVNPPSQLAGITLVWNTIATNFVSETAIASLATQPLVDYVNGIAVGQPINVLDMQNIFQQAVATLIPTALLSSITFTVTINGIETSPEGGTQLIYGDPQSYFSTSAAYVSITQA